MTFIWPEVMVFLFYNPSIEYLCNYLHNESESWSQREMTLNLTNGVFCLCVRERTSGNVCKLYCCSCLWFFISTSNQFSIQDFSKGIYTNICFSIHVLNNFDTRIYSKLQNQVPAYENTVQVDLKLIPSYQKLSIWSMINQLSYRRKSHTIFKKHATISIYGNCESIRKYILWKEHFQIA